MISNAALADARQDCTNLTGDAAIAACSATIRDDPRAAFAYYNRGNAFYRKKEYDRAISDFIRAIEVNPNDANIYNNRGLAYYDRKEYDQAIADYNRAIEINPHDPNPFSNRGLAYKAKGDLDHAIADQSSDLLRRSGRCTKCGRKGAVLQHPSWAGMHVGFEPFPV